jgi:hypothetical protein
MDPPSAGLDPPGRRSRATPTRIPQVPRSRHAAAFMGLLAAAARTPHGASLTNRYGGFPVRWHPGKGPHRTQDRTSRARPYGSAESDPWATDGPSGCSDGPTF